MVSTERNRQKDIIVIGSSGYLGQKMTKLLGQRAVPTHRSTPKFSGSLRYDFYHDKKLPIEAGRKTIVFAAAVEMNQSMNKLEAGMKKLLVQVSDCRFIYISSDAVFSGRKGDYTEAEEPDPVNDYGRNLVLCEQLVQKMVEDHCIVRPSYIFGFVDGQLDTRLSRTRERLSSGGEYVAYEDYYKCPLSVHEVANAVVQLADSEEVGPIHVTGPRMSAYEFHHKAMEALDVDVSRLTREPMPDDATLMRDTSLDSSRWWSMCKSQPLPIRDALQIERFS